MPTNLGRIPVIALDYSEADKAEPKELLIDYDNGGDIYIVSKDGTQIFDITSRVRELIESGELGSNMLINVEGIGNVQLSSYLAYLNENQIIATPSGCVHHSIPRTQCDLNSVVIKNNRLQLFDFDRAISGTIPVKRDGIIKWETPSEINEGEDATNNNNTGNVVLVERNINDKIILKPDAPYQRTAAITVTEDTEVTVVLPTTTNNQYTKITWNYLAATNGPTILFEGNMIWEFVGNDQIQPDSVHVFEFETWDYGMTWFASCKTFGRPTDDFVTYDYLSQNTYSKNDINDFLSWKENKM